MECKYCKKDMEDADTCLYDLIKIDGNWYERDNSYYDINDRCHDCNIVNGFKHIHHYGCDIERCPRCWGQVISCACEKEALKRSDTGEEIDLIN